MMLKDEAVAHVLWNIRHMISRMEDLLDQGLKEQAKASLDSARQEVRCLEGHLEALCREHFKGKP